MSHGISSADAGLETFDKLEIQYEHAYGENPLKKACVNKAITLVKGLDGQPNILDVGCGTGKPVSDMLASAGFEVTGIDISPKMIGHAKARVRGNFFVADLLRYQPETQYAAVFIIFCLLQLTSWDEFCDLMTKYAAAVRPGGYLVVGTMPSDNYVKDKADYDETGTYAVDFDTPFMGVMEKTLFLTTQGLLDHIVALGFSIVSNEIGVFHPNDARCVPEDQQYIIAQKIE